MDKISIIDKVRNNNMDTKEETLVEKKPSIKLVQASRTLTGENGTMFVVKSMVDTIRYEIGQRLTKAQVQELLDDGSMKVSIS